MLYIRLIFAMWSMHKPTRPERLYVDFNGFFASYEEQADPRLSGCPVGVIPFQDARNSCVITANAKAKRFGVKTGIAIAEARRLCPRIALVPQRPDLYVRTQQRIVVAVLSVLPIDVICSIDEFAVNTHRDFVIQVNETRTSGPFLGALGENCAAAVEPFREPDGSVRGQTSDLRVHGCLQRVAGGRVGIAEGALFVALDDGRHPQARRVASG